MKYLHSASTLSSTRPTFLYICIKQSVFTDLLNIQDQKKIQ